METDEVQNRLERAERERDLYRDMLKLVRESGVRPLLESALGALVAATRAEHGYLELNDSLGEDFDRRPTPQYSISRGYSEGDVDRVRRCVSEGIVSEALLSGEIVSTISAMLDPRFKARDSVSSRQIQAVLCAPITGARGRGVVYLEGATGRRGFSSEDRELVGAFAHFLVPIADRILLEQRQAARSDPTRRWRESLRCEQVVGRSPALARVLGDIAAAAPLDIHVLLTGESGTGKTLLASVIHASSPRAGKPFVELNCAAFPDDLVENELFGHERGAFTGASHTTPGKIEAAQEGTLLLDEVSELSLSSQAKLLQLLQSGVYFPLGSNQPKSADVRIVAASNADLEQAVEEGRFRQDLLYRLQVLPIRVPSLEERREDLDELVEHYTQVISRRHRLPRLSVSPGGLAALEGAEWPGNVRQLEHVLTAGMVRAASSGGSQVTELHLFPDVGSADGDGPPAVGLQGATHAFQRQLVERTLRQCNWNVAEAARRLDIHRSYAYKLIDGFGIARNGRAAE